jgi:hypothetical protein
MTSKGSNNINISFDFADKNRKNSNNIIFHIFKIVILYLKIKFKFTSLFKNKLINKYFRSYYFW